MKVTHYMTSKLVTARPADGIRQAFFRMRSEGVRHLPVVDESGKLVGIISDRDLRRPDWVDEAPDLSHIYNLDDSMEVRDLMTSQVHVVHTYDKIRKAVKILLEHRFGAVPVLDKDGSLVGMLPAARIGDKAICIGPIDTIVTGEFTVLIGTAGASVA